MLEKGLKLFLMKDTCSLRFWAVVAILKWPTDDWKENNIFILHIWLFTTVDISYNFVLMKVIFRVCFRMVSISRLLFEDSTSVALTFLYM